MPDSKERTALPFLLADSRAYRAILRAIVACIYAVVGGRVLKHKFIAVSRSEIGEVWDFRICRDGVTGVGRRFIV